MYSKLAVRLLTRSVVRCSIARSSRTLAMADTIVQLPPPIKNAGTRKHFRSIVLPNGLTALLVHDSRPQEDSPDGSDVDETDEEEEADDEDCSEEYEDMSTEGRHN